MVGGKLRGETRVRTAAAVLEASRGRFAAALALGFVLLTVARAVNLTLILLLQRDRPTDPGPRSPRFSNPSAAELRDRGVPQRASMAVHNGGCAQVSASSELDAVQHLHLRS